MIFIDINFYEFGRFTTCILSGCIRIRSVRPFQPPANSYTSRDCCIYDTHWLYQMPQIYVTSYLDYLRIKFYGSQANIKKETYGWSKRHCFISEINMVYILLDLYRSFKKDKKKFTYKDDNHTIFQSSWCFHCILTKLNCS